MFVRGGRTAGVSIVNVDDRFGRRLARVVEGHGGAVARFGRARDADYRLDSASWTMGEARLRLATPRGRLALRCSLPGWHNAYNVAAALAVTDALALDTSATLAAVDGFSAPDGRWRVVEEGQPFDVVVDLAHSPASVAAFMLAARRILADRGHGRLLVLTGAAGGRLDPAKRYKTGRLIGLLADRFTLTTGDPHGAPPGPALDALAAGAAAGGRARVEVEVDRRAAIAKALRSARAGDIVGILGRGAMDRLVLDRSGSHTVPFDDASVAGEALLEAAA
jgi:UDP-N-acetylmuramoyl-L-alanyl-D-glutamate--2,6-diaminopimelate ligase